MWSLAEALGDPHRLARALDCMGNALSQMGDNVRALEFAQRGLALAETIGAVELLVHVRLNMGILCRAIGDYRRGAAVLTQTVDQREQAHAELSAAIDLYRAMDMSFWLSQAEAMLAQVDKEGEGHPAVRCSR